MKLLAAIFLLVASAHARQVSLVWDTPPVSEQVVGWRVWRGIDLIASTNTPSATLQIDNSETSITVTAINSAGESPHSSPLIIPVPMVWIQKSVDLVNWENVVQIPYIEPQQFIRIQLPPN